jgi:tetratricopeptide (TPR) repeat protein
MPLKYFSIWRKSFFVTSVSRFRDLLIIEKGLPNHPDSLLHGPWREFTDIYSWNGNKYARKALIIAKPQFLFQAVQDGDYQSGIGNYDNAILIYQDVISKGDLDWWFEERYLAQLQTDVWGYFPTPTPSAPDSTEYPRLAAYTYYRIMLLHLAQGKEAEAASTYQTLQETFGTDPYAAPYVEMASAFWESYQSTLRMYDGCAAAIQYAVEHPEILVPLGSDYHGWQSHVYEPADVCPFR